jgi:hypothetical protein
VLASSLRLGVKGSIFKRASRELISIRVDRKRRYGAKYFYLCTYFSLGYRVIYKPITVYKLYSLSIN